MISETNPQFTDKRVFHSSLVCAYDIFTFDESNDVCRNLFFNLFLSATWLLRYLQFSYDNDSDCVYMSQERNLYGIIVVMIAILRGNHFDGDVV